MKDKVKQVIANEIDINPASIKDNATLESIGLDSLETGSVVMELEDYYNLYIPDAKITGDTTVADLARLFEELKGVQ